MMETVAIPSNVAACHTVSEDDLKRRRASLYLDLNKQLGFIEVSQYIPNCGIFCSSCQKEKVSEDLEKPAVR
jgi:hypothetical protein